MKKIFYLLFIFSISSLYAQVDYSKKIIAKKIQIATLNYDDNNYYFDGDAVDFKFTLIPEENYYIILEGNEEARYEWEYVRTNESVMIYQDEEGNRLDFDFNAGQIRYYSEYNDTTEFYESVLFLSELEIVRKKSTGEYIPQSIRSTD